MVSLQNCIEDTSFSDVARIDKVSLNNLQWAQSYSPWKEDSNDTQFAKLGPPVLKLKFDRSKISSRRSYFLGNIIVARKFDHSRKLVVEGLS